MRSGSIKDTYLDVSESLCDNFGCQRLNPQSINKIGVKSVKVRFNAGTFHDKVLSNPGDVISSHNFLQLFSLGKEKTIV